EDDFAAQVAVGDRGHDAGDATHLVGEVPRHQIHAVRQVFPGAGNALDLCLAAQLAFGTDLAGDAGDFGAEVVELVADAVDGLSLPADRSADVDGDLVRQVAVGDRRHDVGDATHLVGEVPRHQIHAVRQVFPGAGDTPDLCLAAQLAFGTDLAGDA